MLRDLAGAIWKRAPRFALRWSMRLTQSHFTVTAAGVVLDRQDRILLLKHRFRAGSGWGIPGGFIEAGEQPEEGLRRELREEIGLELETAKLIKVRTFKKAKQMEIIYRCRTHGTASPRSGEIIKAGWFDLNSLPEGLPEDQSELIRQAMNHGAKRED